MYKLYSTSYKKVLRLRFPDMFHSTAAHTNVCKKQIRWIMSATENNVWLLLGKTLTDTS